MAIAIEELKAITGSTVDDCEEIRRHVQRIERINARIKTYSAESSDNTTDLPSDLCLTTGYGHLTTMEQSLLHSMRKLDSS